MNRTPYPALKRHEPDEATRPSDPAAYWMGTRWVIPHDLIEAGGGHTYVARATVSERVTINALVLAPTVEAARQAAADLGPDVRITTIDGRPDYDYAIGGSDATGTDRPARNPDAEPKPMSEAERAALNEAREYAKNYTGRFAFMLDMRERVTNPTVENGKGRLSPRQVAAILRCKLTDEESRKREAAERLVPETVDVNGTGYVTARGYSDANRAGRAAPVGVDLSAFPEGRTHAAVENNAGSLTFLIIDRVADADSRWNGWTFVKQQVGDSEVRLGNARPGGTYRGEHPHLIERVLADIPAAVVRYGHELGVCGICGRNLTEEGSRAAGIGPVCASKIGGI